MEAILVDHASLSRPEAVLTVEIARHCRQIADCAFLRREPAAASPPQRR